MTMVADALRGVVQGKDPGEGLHREVLIWDPPVVDKSPKPDPSPP